MGEPDVCAFCGRTTDSGGLIHKRGSLPGAAPYGVCCERCDAQVRELMGRLARISRAGHKDSLAFDPGSDQEVRRVWRRKAHATAVVNRLLGRLRPVTPSAARIIAVTEAVFVPDEPTLHPDSGSARADIANRITNALQSVGRTYSCRLGTVGADAGIVLQKAIDDLLSSQYIYLLDTENSVHAFYWYSR